MEQNKVTGKPFMANDREFDSFVFSGIRIRKEGKKYITHVDNYSNNLREVSSDWSFTYFREGRQEIV